MFFSLNLIYHVWNRKKKHPISNCNLISIKYLLINFVNCKKKSMGNGVGIQLSIGWFNSIFNFNFVL
jgi:hypothetical protein